MDNKYVVPAQAETEGASDRNPWVPVFRGGVGHRARGCICKSGAFFDRYLAQMADNGGVWAEP